MDFLITQLFFDNNHYLSFRDRAQAAGIEWCPLWRASCRFSAFDRSRGSPQVCGARIPKSLLRKIEPVEDDAEAVRHIGMYHATQQCLDLLDHDVPGIHFYTLNRSTATRAIYQLIRASFESTQRGGQPVSAHNRANLCVDARP